MQDNVKSACLLYIQNEWRSLTPCVSTDKTIEPPGSVWIRLYNPVPKGTTDLPKDKIIQQAWFMDSEGIHERDVMSYARFETVNLLSPRYLFNFKKPSDIFGVPYHRIGMAAFCEIIDSDWVYLETNWGGRHGRGWYLKIEKDGVISDERGIWIS